MELMNDSGISKTHIYEIERGNRIPTLITLEKLAKALNVRMCALYEADCPWSEQ